MRTSEVLNRAADLIEEFGWKQGSWGLAYNGAPILPVCTEGAILAASGLGETFWRAQHSMEGESPEDVMKACPAAQSVFAYLDVWDLASWNDAPGRTASEVIEALRACAVIEASREREVAEVSA